MSADVSSSSLDPQRHLLAWLLPAYSCPFQNGWGLGSLEDSFLIEVTPAQDGLSQVEEVLSCNQWNVISSASHATWAGGRGPTPVLPLYMGSCKASLSSAWFPQKPPSINHRSNPHLKLCFLELKHGAQDWTCVTTRSVTYLLPSASVPSRADVAAGLCQESIGLHWPP